MMFWNGGDWGFWEVTLMWVMMIAFWGLLIWAVYALITGAFRGSGPERRGDGAHRILDERLAHGEIEAEEYRRLRDVIDASHAPRSAGRGARP